METKVIRDEILYYENFIENPREAYGNLLEEFFAQQPQLVLYGGPRISNLSFQTDRPNSYTEMVGLERQAMRRRLWRPFTALLAGQVAFVTEVTPSAVIGNFYRNGNDFLYPHADYDRALGPTVEDVVIATASLGVPRSIKMRRIDGNDELQHVLQPGSLFVMRGRTQRNWLHSIPKTDDTGSRFSLTFVHHQTDPLEKRCWLLSEISPETHAYMKQAETAYSSDPIADALLNFEGRPPTPVLISSREAVFSEWCRRSNPENYVVMGGRGGDQVDNFVTPRALLQAYPELEEHIPEDSKVQFSRTSRKIDPVNLPAPKDIPFNTLPSEWIEEAVGLGIEEMEERLKKA